MRLAACLIALCRAVVRSESYAAGAAPPFTIWYQNRLISCLRVSNTCTDVSVQRYGSKNENRCHSYLGEQSFCPLPDLGGYGSCILRS